MSAEPLLEWTATGSEMLLVCDRTVAVGSVVQHLAVDGAKYVASVSDPVVSLAVSRRDFPYEVMSSSGQRKAYNDALAWVQGEYREALGLPRVPQATEGPPEPQGVPGHGSAQETAQERPSAADLAAEVVGLAMEFRATADRMLSRMENYARIQGFEALRQHHNTEADAAEKRLREMWALEPTPASVATEDELEEAIRYHRAKAKEAAEDIRTIVIGLAPSRGE